MEDNLDNIVYISRQIGCSAANAQGAGGNTSVKLDQRIMAVKASGYALKDVSAEEGFSFIDYPALRESLNEPAADEAAFNATIARAQVSFGQYKKLRPSIEAGLHAMLKARYVIHTHSVYANVLACCRGGRSLAGKILGDITWVDYACPGKAIISALREKMEAGAEEKIIFLANHGVVVTGETAEEVLLIHEQINRKIRDALKLKEFDENNMPRDIDAVRRDVLFPDQIVYTLTNEFLNTTAARQTLAAYQYIKQSLAERDLPCAFIPAAEARIISEMESEKYRKLIIS